MTVESLLSDPDVLGDQKRLRDVSRRYKELTPVVTCIRRIESRRSDAVAARDLLETTDDATEREQLRAERDDAEAEVEQLEEELRVLLLPKDPNDGRPVIIEIRGAEGGEEANLFARDLYDMYVAYAARKGWKTETIAFDPSDLGGPVHDATDLSADDDANGDTPGARFTATGRGVLGGDTVAKQEGQLLFAASEGLLESTPDTNMFIAQVEDVQAKINTARVQAGSQYAALESAVQYTTDLTAQYELGYNTVNDVNFSMETAHLAKNQILQQAATAMLAQANSGQQGLLQLLQ